MIVVSNSSPLITLARVGQFDLLRQLFNHIHIAAEVHVEVVLRGSGKPAAALVPNAPWIEIHPAAPIAEIAALHSRYPLGAGELATVLLAKKLRSDLIIIDERAARRLAQSDGLAIIGCVGLLEAGHRRGLVNDLRAIYQNLLSQGIRVHHRILEQSLKDCGLPPL